MAGRPRTAARRWPPPHVAGVAALYKATFGDADYKTIRTWLADNATAGVISGNPSGTPNLLLYTNNL